MNKLTPQQKLINFSFWKWYICLAVSGISSCQQPHSPIAHAQINQKSIAEAHINYKRFATPQVTSLISNPPEIIYGAKPVIRSGAGVTQFFTHYGTEQGLPLNSVLCNFPDNEGNIWFGTAGGGVSRYDGNKFTNYNLSCGLASSVVFAINEDEKNNLWFGTSAGITKYDGYSFKNYTIANGLSGNFISCIAKDNKANLWFGSHEGGISKFDGKKFINFTTNQGLADNYVQCMRADKNGTLWIGTATGGISNFDGIHFRNFTTADGLADNSVSSILQDNEGMLWFGTKEGASRFDGSRFTTFTTRQGLPENDISCMAVDYGGNIWFGTHSNGVSKYDGEKFTDPNGIPELKESNVTSISMDQAGNLWTTSLGGGINRYEDNQLLNYALPAGLAGKTIFSILKDKRGNLWLGTQEGGLIKYDGKRFTNFTTKQGLADDWIWSLLEDKEDNIWFTTDKGGVGKYDGKKLTRYTTEQGLAGNSVNCIMQDKNGNFWFGTFSGASKFDGSHFTTYTSLQGLPGNNIESIIEDDEGNIWFATHDNGISKFNGKTFINYTTANGLAGNTVYFSLKDHNGNLWFGTNKGASRYEEGKFVNYTTDQGLPDNIIWAIGEDTTRKIIWFGTNSGLAALKETSAGKKEGYNFEIFNQNNGYPIKAINAGALFVENNGTVWLGSEHNKLIRFDYQSLSQRDTIPVRIKIQSIKVNNENICWNYINNIRKNKSIADSLTLIKEMIETFGKVPGPASLHTMAKKFRDIQFDRITRFYPIPENLVLPHDVNTLTFDFTAISSNIPGEVKYQYLLENYSKDWSPPGTVTTANFGNIEPGNYIFKVKALIPSGKWTEVTYSFKVLPPWWTSWWAYTLYVLIAGGAFYGFYQNHIRSLERRQATQINIMVATQEEERRRIARDLHDEVGIKLSALKLFLSSLSEQTSATGSGEINLLAVRSENLISEAMQDVRRLLLNLSPGVLEEFGYVTAIEGLIRKINETGKMHFNLTIFGLEQRLQKDYELALYRITEELINNAIKHSDAKMVSLQIGQRDEKIILMIEDDGKGFEVNNQRNGNGLHNLETRSRLMHGTITIDSTPGKGTSIIIEIPYNYQSV